MNQKPFLIKIIHYLLIGIVFLTPLCVTNQFVFSPTPEKTFLFFTLVEIAAAFWLVVVFAKKEYFSLHHPIFIAGGLFLFVYTVAGVFGDSPESSFFSSISRMSGLILLYHVALFAVLLFTTVRDKETWHRILITAVSAGGIVAILEWGHDLFDFSQLASGSTIGNSSYAGTYLLFVFFIAVILFFHSSGKKRFFLGSVIILIGSCPLFFSVAGVHSILSDPFGVLGIARAASGALIVGIIFSGLLYASMVGKGAVRILSKIITSLFVLVVLWGMVSIHVPNSFTRQLLEEEGVGSRFVFWESAFSGILEHPFLGYGPENYSIPFYAYFESALYIDKYGSGLETNTDRPHNTYLGIAVTGGVLSLFAYLSIFGALVYSLLSAWRFGLLPYADIAAFGGFVLACLIEKAFFFDTMTSYIMFVMVLGYVAFHSQNEMPDAYPRLPSSISFRGAAIAIFVFCFMFFICVYGPYKQQSLLIEMTEHMTVMERTENYSRLFYTSVNGHLTTMEYLMTKMIVAVPEVLSTTTQKERDILLEDARNLHREVERYSADTTHYRLVFLLTRLSFLEYVLTQDGEEKKLILEQTSFYEKQLEHLSPNNPANYWISAQQALFAEDIGRAEDVLAEAIEKYPDIGTSAKFLESVRQYKEGDQSVPFFSF